MIVVGVGLVCELVDFVWVYVWIDQDDGVFEQFFDFFVLFGCQVVEKQWNGVCFIWFVVVDVEVLKYDERC